MTSRVHAILVVRSDAHRGAKAHLERTLAALSTQTKPVDELTIVLCGRDRAIKDIVSRSGATAVIEAPGKTRFARAVGIAVNRVRDTDAVWLLAQDTAPEQGALAALTGALEVSPSVAFVAPKLVRWNDPEHIVSFGVSMTRFGESIDLVGGELAGEFDQGQLDTRIDTLGSDIRGVLLRSGGIRALLPDPALAGADEGLDLGVRARLAGGRVALAPRARVAVAGDGVAGLPVPGPASHNRRITFAERLSTLHRRLSYASLPMLFLHWLLILPLAILRMMADLLQKEPGRVLPELMASIIAPWRFGAIARSRRMLRAHSVGGWSLLDQLRVGRDDLRDRFDGTIAGRTRNEVRFFSGGGAWTVLGGLLLGVICFPTIFAWPAIGGGGMLPLRASILRGWHDAGYGMRSTGLADVGAADPFASLMALLGTIIPGSPSYALVLLWAFSFGLAAFGAWFLISRLTAKRSLRIVGSVMWMLAPTFLTALMQGRPGAVLAHILLPWLGYTITGLLRTAQVDSRRAWGSAGSASILLVLVLACAPSLVVALSPVLLVTLLVVIVTARFRALPRLIWMIVPTAVLFAPLFIERLHSGQLISLLADPGAPSTGAVASDDAEGRLQLLFGFPAGQGSGWDAFLPPELAQWAPVLLIPLALLALLSAFSRRSALGAALIAIAASGVLASMFLVGVFVSHAGDQLVAIWPGSSMSIAWLALLLAALVTLDAGFRAPKGEYSGAIDRGTVIRTTAATITALALIVIAFPQASLFLRDGSDLTNGPRSTLPAYVALEGVEEPAPGTLVLTPRNGGEISARVVWGESDTLNASSTTLNTKTSSTDGDHALSKLVADLVSHARFDAQKELLPRGIRFILIDGTGARTRSVLTVSDETEGERGIRLQMTSAIDARQSVVRVGETVRGTLWRIEGTAGTRPELSPAELRSAHFATWSSLVVVLIGLLLSLPTARSRRLTAPATLGRDAKASLDDVIVRDVTGGGSVDAGFSDEGDLS